MITTDLTTLKINKLTKAQYEAALASGNINENELYMTPESEEKSGGVFIINLTSSTAGDGTTTVSSDKTYSEIKSAYNEGKACFLRNGLLVYSLVFCDIPIYFSTVFENTVHVLKLTASDGIEEWSYFSYTISQPDWNVNDETSSEYIKNRPFYTGDIVETYIVQDASLAYSGSSDSVKFYTFPSFFNLVEGATYKVYFNGIIYECVCSVLQGSVFCIGNRSIPQVGDDTGEPFLIYTDNSTQTGMYTTDTSENFVVSISTMAPEIVKINEKYLPVATDDSYGVINTSNLVYAYNFPSAVNSSDMIKAIEQFNKSKAIIIWSNKFVYNAYYDSSDSSIYIYFTSDPFVKYKYEIDPDSSQYIESLREVYYTDYSEVYGITFSPKKFSDTSYSSYMLSASDGVLKFEGNPIAYKHNIDTSLLESSKWDSSTKTYSFETKYPKATYDIEIALNSTATSEQAEAFNGAQIAGSATSNIIKAYGYVPTVDIPIIIRVVTK